MRHHGLHALPRRDDHYRHSRRGLPRRTHAFDLVIDGVRAGVTWSERDPQRRPIRILERDDPLIWVPPAITVVRRASASVMSKPFWFSLAWINSALFAAVVMIAGLTRINSGLTPPVLGPAIRIVPFPEVRKRSTQPTKVLPRATLVSVSSAEANTGAPTSSIVRPLTA